MKTQRHAAILRIVRGETVGSQEQLRERLKSEGFNVTQATLSRDIRELGLAKVAAPDGGSHYAAAPEGAPGVRRGRRPAARAEDDDGSRAGAGPGARRRRVERDHRHHRW